MRGGNRCSPILRGRRRKGSPAPALPRLREFAEGSSPPRTWSGPVECGRGKGGGKLLIHVLRRPRPPSIVVGREAKAIDDATLPPLQVAPPSILRWCPAGGFGVK